MLERITLLSKRLFRRPVSPQRFFLLIAAPISLSLAFIVPPFQAPDEHTHFYKEVYLSRGHLLAKEQRPPHRVGDYLPAKYSETVDHYRYMFLDHTQKANKSQIKQDLLHPNNDNRPTITDFENTAQYPPLAYLPQAVAIFFTNLLHGSVLLQLYAARVMTAVCWLVLIFFAIRWLPIAKWGAVALNITPLTLFLGMSSSNDAITFGLSMLTIAATLRAIVKPGLMKRAELWTLYGLGLALALCKPPYLILTGLMLAIPVKRFRDRKNYLLTMCKLLGGVILVALFWEILVKPILLNFYPGSSTDGQLHYILQHPIATAIMIIKTLVIYPIGDDMTLQLIGLKAWVDAQTPFWLIGLSYILVVVGTLYIPARQRAIVLTSVAARYLSALLMIGGILLVSLLLYITYTPVGLNTIIGLQGRYFVPLSYLLLPILGGRKDLSLHLSGNSLRAFKIGLIFVSVCTWPLIISRFYYAG